MNQRVTAAGNDAARLIEQFTQRQAEALQLLAHKLSGLFTSGGQLLVAASGQLQPLAQVLAGHFCFRLGFDRPVLPVQVLGSDPVLVSAMGQAAQLDQLLVRHYRALRSEQQMLLLFSDGQEANCLRNVRDEALENAQSVALLSAIGENDPLCRDGVELCLDLGTQHPARLLEMTLLVGNLLCELVEAELFGV